MAVCVEILVASRSLVTEEVRKLQFTGRSSFVVSLPKRWVEQMALRPGDPVSIIRQNPNSLLILPRGKVPPERMGEAMLVVTPDEDPEALARKIIAAYVGGYNVLHLKPKLDRLNAAHRAVVKQLVQKNLLGSVIVADASEQMTIQILLSVPEMSVKSALRRMSAIAAAMHRDALRALREGDRDLAQSVMSSDDEVDRFTLYVIRNLGLAANSERLLREIELAQVSECLDFRVATKSIERVADHAVRIAEIVGNLGAAPESPVVEPLRQMSDEALSLFEDGVEALLRRDYLLAEDVLKRLPSIYKHEMEALQAVQGKATEDSASLKLIVEDLRRTGEYAGDIAEIALNLTIHQLLVT